METFLNKIRIKLENIGNYLLEKKYIEYIENIDTNTSSLNLSEFLKNYNDFIISYYDIININLELKDLKEIKFKDKESIKIINLLNDTSNNLQKNAIKINNLLNSLFNKFNIILSRKIENGNIDLKELFNNITKLDNKIVQELINENNSGDNRFTPYSFIIENDEKLFELTNYLENEQKIKKEYYEYLEVDEIINDNGKKIEVTFNKDLPEKHKELLAITLKKNFKFLFNKILGNPSLSDEEKVDKIETIFRENIENNFLGILNIVFVNNEEIFKYNYLGKIIFERLISKENKNGINKNIRLKFVENYDNIDELLEYLYTPFNNKNKYEEKIIIKLGVRSTIAILKRLEKEKNITKDSNKREKYINYITFYKKILIDRYKKNQNELELNKSYNEDKNIENIKLIKNYLETENIEQLKEEIYTNFNYIIENKKHINLQEEIDNNNIEKIKSSDLTKMIQKGTYAHILFNMFENGKITRGKKGWKKKIALAILENSKNFTINILLNDNFFSEQDKEQIILEFITKGNNLIKQLEILNIIKCTKVPGCVEEFMVNSIKCNRIINKLVVYPKVFHIFA